MSKPVCPWPMDDQGFVSLNTVKQPEGGCTLPEGFKGFTAPVAIYDDLGHKLDGDYDPHGKNGCQHKETAEWKAHHKVRKAHRKVQKERKMAEHEVTATLPDRHPELVAAAEQPANSLADIQKLVPADGNVTGMTVALAVVGVAGSGALVKFYRDWQKSKHEENMKRLEIEEKKADKQDDSHQKCAVERIALEARISDLDAKLSKVEKKSMALSFGDDFDPEELQARLVKLEKLMKGLNKKEKE